MSGVGQEPGRQPQGPREGSMPTPLEAGGGAARPVPSHGPPAALFVCFNNSFIEV